MRRAIVLCLALAGCMATAPVAREFDRTAAIPGADFNRVWDSVIDLFGERTWAIDNMERASGLIVTDWMNAGDRGADIMDCGRPGGLAVDSSPSVRFNVVVREGEGTPTLTVNTNMRTLRGLGNNQAFVDCLSTGVLEREVHEEVMRRVGS